MYNNNTIFYARVSSNSSEQIRSLQNQLQLLNNYKKKYTNNIVISEVISISDGMSNKIKKEILKYDNVNIIVTHMDRLTRNISDINFIKNNIKYILVLSEQKTYNVNTDWKQILNLTISSTEEIEKIKKRIKSSESLRKRKYEPDEIIISAKKRCIEINNIISKKKNSKIFDDIAEMIKISQNLQNCSDWDQFSNISKKYKGESIEKNYHKILDNFDDTISYHIPRKDIYQYVEYIFNKLNIKLDINILKEFVNAHINLGKKCAIHDSIYPENEISKIASILLNMTYDTNIKNILNINELYQLKNIANKLNNVILKK